MIEIKFLKSENKSIALEDNKIIGECQFVEEKNTWNIIHTFVSNEYRGQNIARKLVECVIEEAEKNNKKIIADCSYEKKVLLNR